MRSPRFLLAGLLCLAPLVLGGCSMPHVLGLGSYYEVTDTASGHIYYTQDIKRQSRGVVEFIDPASDALISVPGASIRKISEADFRAGRQAGR